MVGNVKDFTCVERRVDGKAEYYRRCDDAVQSRMQSIESMVDSKVRAETAT